MAGLPSLTIDAIYLSSPCLSLPSPFLTVNQHQLCHLLIASSSHRIILPAMFAFSSLLHQTVTSCHQCVAPPLLAPLASFSPNPIQPDHRSWTDVSWYLNHDKRP